MIHEYLLTGAAYPITGRELATIFNCDIREIVVQIERERRQGFPICASNRRNHSEYYLAADRDELETYCKRLHQRAGELHKTRRFLLKALDKMPES